MMVSKKSQEKQWSPGEKELIEWFKEAHSKGTLPMKPFDRVSRFSPGGAFVPFGRVFGPEKYYEALLGSIAQGPSGARVIYGALQTDLQHLRYFYGPDGEKHRKEANITEST